MGKEIGGIRRIVDNGGSELAQVRLESLFCIGFKKNRRLLIEGRKRAVKGPGADGESYDLFWWMIQYDGFANSSEYGIVGAADGAIPVPLACVVVSTAGLLK